MSKTITIRLGDDVYERFSTLAKQKNRGISNLIETLAFRKMEEDQFVSDDEMASIWLDKALIKNLQTGSAQAKKRQGNFVD